MRRSVRLVTAVALTSMSAMAGAAQSPGAPTAVIGVHVVDVVTGEIRHDRTVIIRDGYIAEEISATTEPPPSATIVEGRGRYVIPGLWDMHVHQSLPRLPAAASQRAEAERLRARYYESMFLAHGVTGVRDMGGDGARLLEARALYASASGPSANGAGANDDDERGVRVRTFMTGAILGTAPVVPGAPFPLRSAQDVEQSVQLLKENGAAHVKIRSLPPDLLATALASCRREGIRCVAHAPESPNLVAAVNAGLAGVTHLFWFPENASRIPFEQLVAWSLEAETPTLLQRVFYKLGLRQRPPSVDSLRVATYDPERARRVFGALAASGTWVTPTLTIHDLMLRVGRRLDAARDTTFFLEAGTPGLFSETRSAKTLRLAAENWALYQQVVRDLRDAGVKLLAGSDVPTQIVAGAGLQAELILLQRAGLSPLEALQTATLQPARYFAATDSMGTIAPGHVADLVFLARNPLEDVANVQTIEGVMIDGHMLERPQIDALIEQARQAAARFRALRAAALTAAPPDHDR